MAGITLETAEAQLQRWLDADARLAKGESVEFDGHRLKRADTQAKIEYWDGYCKRLSRRQSGSAVGRVSGRG
jgi:hypothetical protein